MSAPLLKPQKNQTMELAKMVAAVMVVLVHVPFPGRVGRLLELVARFAVPMFLVITGYFNYGANAATIARRLRYILKLTLFASLFYACSNALNAWLMGNPVSEFLAWNSVIPRIPALTRWLVFQLNPFSEHLWYLSAAVLCYCLLWVWVSFQGEKSIDYRTLYLVGSFFGVLLLYCAVILPWTGSGATVHTYRNGWLTGIPMFTLGIFLHEYQDTLRKNLHLTDTVLILLILLGQGISLCEWISGFAGEMTLGVLILVPSLVLLMSRHPQLPVQTPWLNALVNRMRSLSTAVYILHCSFIWVYGRFFQGFFLSLLGTNGESWLRPILLLLITMLAALVWNRLETAISKRK